jgi:DNA-binding winged helix-turn-helix (wHTH) protein
MRTILTEASSMLIPTAPPPPGIAQAIDEARPGDCAQWPGRSFVFGAFVLQPERQLLSSGGAPVRIGGRALDLLAALVARPGQLLSKQELIASAWPAIFVDEANLKVNIATLRRALGEEVDAPRFIATVIGRGYRFIAPVRLVEPQPRFRHTGEPPRLRSISWSSAIGPGAQRSR